MPFASGFFLDLEEINESLGLGIGERAQEHRLDHAEERGRGADPRGESDGSGENEAGPLREATNRLAKILREAVPTPGFPEMPESVRNRPSAPPQESKSAPGVDVLSLKPVSELGLPLLNPSGALVPGNEERRRSHHRARQIDEKTDNWHGLPRLLYDLRERAREVLVMKEGFGEPLEAFGGHFVVAPGRPLLLMGDPDVLPAGAHEAVALQAGEGWIDGSARKPGLVHDVETVPDPSSHRLQDLDLNVAQGSLRSFHYYLCRLYI
jgi:hypothetical protein